MNYPNSNGQAIKITFSPFNPAMDLYRTGQTPKVWGKQGCLSQPDLSWGTGGSAGLRSPNCRVADRRAPTLFCQQMVGISLKYSPPHRLYHLCGPDLGRSISEGAVQLRRNSQQFGLGGAFRVKYDLYWNSYLGITI